MLFILMGFFFISSINLLIFCVVVSRLFFICWVKSWIVLWFGLRLVLCMCWWIYWGNWFNFIGYIWIIVLAVFSFWNYLVFCDFLFIFGMINSSILLGLGFLAYFISVFFVLLLNLGLLWWIFSILWLLNNDMLLLVCSRVF